MDKPHFSIELPDTSKTHKPDLLFEKTKYLSNELFLNQLYKGVDSFELRLWAQISVTREGRVYIIKKINNNWKCILYNYVLSINQWSSGNYLEYLAKRTIDTFSVKKLQPKTNWIDFFKLIEKENIYNLPSQEDIKGWKNKIDDGIIYKVEIATKNKYKFYYYNCPDIYEKEFKECKQMTNILDIFNKEFDLNFGIYGSYKCGQ